MSFQTLITIAEAIDNIEANRYFLPCIQREFGWPSESIESQFDSRMRYQKFPGLVAKIPGLEKKGA